MALNVVEMEVAAVLRMADSWELAWVWLKC